MANAYFGANKFIFALAKMQIKKTKKSKSQK